MFGILTNLTKAAAAVAMAPVAAVADIVTLPISATDLDRGPFDRTASMLNAAGKAAKKAVE